MGLDGQRHAPTALPPGKTRYPLCRRLGGPQVQSGQVRKISPSPGFDPRTFQPVASRYTFLRYLGPNNNNNNNNIMAMVVVFKIRIDAVFLKVTKRHGLGRLLPL